MPKTASKTPKAMKSGRVPLNMRVTPETRISIENAAEKSGRSLAAEVEHQIEDYSRLKAAFAIATQDPELQRHLRELARLRDITNEVSEVEALEPDQLFYKCAEQMFAIHLASKLDGKDCHPWISENAIFLVSRSVSYEAVPRLLIEYWSEKLKSAESTAHKEAARTAIEVWTQRAGLNE